MAQSQTLQNSKTDLLSTQNIIFNGRRITSAGNAVAEQDYVTLSQVNSLISAAIPTTTTNRTQININGIIKNGQPGAILFVGSQGQLSQDSVNFKYDQGNQILDLVNLNISSLTISKPVKSDANKNLVSGLIVLTTDVSGILKVVNGGTQLATLTAHAVLIGNGTGTVSFATIGTAGNVLTDNGVGADPTFQAIPGLPNVGPGAGTYIVGYRLTPTGNDGTITLDAQGRITGVQQAT